MSRGQKRPRLEDTVDRLRALGALALPVSIFLAILISAGTGGAQTIEDLAKKVQNPVSDLISVPIEENVNFGDLGGEVQHVINVSPVYPLELNDDWLLINRAIIPAIYQPSTVSGAGDKFGLGDINLTTFLSPREAPGGYFWGIGPSVTFPSATDEVLGEEKWSLGPSFVLMKEHGPWAVGFLVANLWSVGGKSDRAEVNRGFVQPWLYFNFPSGEYIFYEPIITVDWKADSDESWTVPLGIGVGKIFTIGSQYMNAQVAGFYNVEKPPGVSDWTIRIQIQFLFPN
jgi:hypothetical protein